MAFDIRLPNINGPTDSQRITQITRYLYQLAEDLKYNLNTLEAGTSDMTSIERIGVLDSLDDWKLKIDGAQMSIATIRQKVSSQGSSIEMLTEWKSGVEDEISSIASIKQTATSQGASIEMLTEWKNGVNDNVSSIAQIKQDVSANGASITSLAEWKSGVEGDVSSIASIEQRVTDAESTIKLLTELNAGDTTSLAELVNRVSATEANITGLTTWKNGVVSSIAKIEQISTEDFASITGLAQFRSDTAATEARIEGKADANAANISALAEWKDSVNSDISSISGIKATADANAASLVGLSEFKTNTSTSLARIEGKADANAASLGLVVDNGVVKGGILIEAINNESAAKISADRLDIEGKTLNIKVASTNITGKLTASQIDASNLNVVAANITGQLTANQIDASELKVAAANITGGLTIGQLPSDVATKSGVVSIIDGRITADFIKTLGLEVGNHIKMGSGATISWNSIDDKPTDLATTSQVKTTISESSIRTDQIECTDLNAFGATIGGFTIDNNSLHSSMSSTSDRILLCSGTSKLYTVGGHSSTGWSIIAGSNFGVLKNGTMYASNANISGEITATSGFIGGFGISDNMVHSMSGVYGTYSYTTTGTNLKYATGYAFTVMTPSGICYYINQSNDFNSKTIAIIHQQIGGSGISGEDISGGTT